MDLLHAYFHLLVFFIIMLFFNGVKGGPWNISVEEDLDFERQLRALNKPSIKTILSEHGEIFDCVDFYKQPAFDYARLNNYTIEHEYKPTLSRGKARDPLDIIGTKGEECPLGSVPIKRITKEDLIRERLASKYSTLADNNEAGTHYAVVRSTPDVRLFVEVGGTGSVWNPRVSGKQFSAGRLKISHGTDSIEAGWRVDPTLYGDTNTHFYVRTDAGGAHCFDVGCGFVVIDKNISPGKIILPTSQAGGPIRDLELFFEQDRMNFNWYLEYGPERKPIGKWPKSLFTGGKSGLAWYGTLAEWGGVVFSPPGTPKPAMGTGNLPYARDYNWDACFRKLLIKADGIHLISPKLLESFVDTQSYQVTDIFSGDSDLDRTMFYGGAATPSI